MKRVTILGSTGSIGKSALDVIARFPGRFEVVGLTTNSNIDTLYQQIKHFRPSSVCVRDERAALKLEAKLGPKSTKLFVGEAGLEEMVTDRRADVVLLAISGSGALLPLLKAIAIGKDVALANKEALVMAGPIIMRKAKNKKIKIIPIDSEQSAIWQCLDGQGRNRLKNIYLTASGGPFRLKAAKELKMVSIAEVLRHPRWKMGKKISVDSATLMNKGLELLEAMYLFNIGPDKIKILVHPEAIIHSMVEFIDGVIMAQLSVTDMRIPIQYALSYPERLPGNLAGIDFYKLRKLNFQKPDFNKFPCLALAYRVAKASGTLPCVLNAANEICVDEFLKRRLDFISIATVIRKTIDRHRNIADPGLDDILATDAWARRETYKIIAHLN